MKYKIFASMPDGSLRDENLVVNCNFNHNIIKDLFKVYDFGDSYLPCFSYNIMNNNKEISVVYNYTKKEYWRLKLEE